MSHDRPRLPPEVIEKATEAANESIEPHDFEGVAGHPDDDECTYREDGTDATYCGRPRAAHDHHPNCYQSTGAIPDDLPDDLCDCRVLRMLDAPEVAADAYQRGMAEGARQVLAEMEASDRLACSGDTRWHRRLREAVARIENPNSKEN